MSEVQPLLEILEDLAPSELHARACNVCTGEGWFFGHATHDGDAARFWKLDLDGDPTFDAIWEQVKERCEAMAGAPLRVIRQYANGHTYGLGGKPHVDNDRPGSFTLLYYPMEEWPSDWDGETVFLDPDGDIALSVRPRPNRGVFFDSRIPHAGRAPSRSCTALRVTVAYKLEATPTENKDAVPKSENSEPPGTGIEETERHGATRVYRAMYPADQVSDLVRAHLEARAKTIRLPGFRAGKIPVAVMVQRYGAAGRAEVASQLAAQAADRIFSTGGLASSIEMIDGTASGDLKFRIAVTHLADLPQVDFTKLSLERLIASDKEREAAGLAAEAAQALLDEHLRQQVLDHLDSAYGFTLAPPLIDREFRAISQVAESQLDSSVAGKAERESIAAELRVIAERRVRLGAVVKELARRNDFQLTGRQMEDKVIAWIVAQATVSKRAVRKDELQELAT
jgi:SM-20-related protein